MSSIVRLRGGCRRIRFPQEPPFDMRRPASRVFSMISECFYRSGCLELLSFTISIPIRKPLPRRSPTNGDFSWTFLILFMKQVLRLYTFSWSFYSWMIFSTSIPTRHWIGPPENVLKYTFFTESEIYFLVTTAPKGIPFPIALAITTISGLAPCHLKPQKSLPILPKPVCTSSEMQSPPYFRTLSKMFFIQPSGRGMIPPTPRTGSAINAAIFPDVLLCRISSHSRQQSSGFVNIPLYAQGVESFQ